MARAERRSVTLDSAAQVSQRKGDAFADEGSTLVGSATGQRALSLAGAGIAAIPANIVESDLESGRLVRLLGRYRLPQISFYAVYPGNIGPAPKTRAFIDLIKQPAM